MSSDELTHPSAPNPPVPALLAILSAEDVVVDDSEITAHVHVEPGNKPTIVLDLGTARWTLRFDHPAGAAYVAGKLAHAAGVTDLG